MKIAIPVAQGKLYPHFGHAEEFALVEVDEQKRTIRSCEFRVPPPHEPGVLPRWLQEQGIRVLIAGGIGRRAQELLARAGIEVKVGVISEEPDALVRDYLAGSLRSGPNVCEH